MKNNINNTLLCSQSCELSTLLCFVIKENIFWYVFARNPEKISCLSRTCIWNSNVLGDTWKWFLQSNVLTLVESLVTHIQDAAPAKEMTRIQCKIHLAWLSNYWCSTAPESQWHVVSETMPFNCCVSYTQVWRLRTRDIDLTHRGPWQFLTHAQGSHIVTNFSWA